MTTKTVSTAQPILRSRYPPRPLTASPQGTGREIGADESDRARLDTGSG
jgi:hypothetical protein